MADNTAEQVETEREDFPTWHKPADMKLNDFVESRVSVLEALDQRRIAP